VQRAASRRRHSKYCSILLAQARFTGHGQLGRVAFGMAWALLTCSGRRPRKTGVSLVIRSSCLWVFTQDDGPATVARRVGCTSAVGSSSMWPGKHSMRACPLSCRGIQANTVK
jgi:hypothetical protein